MKTALILLLSVFTISVNAKTIMQCAVDNVQNGGVRVNVKETNGVLRANLIFGTTVSGTMYQMEKNKSGLYAGWIKNQPSLRLFLVVSSNPARNANIEGFAATLSGLYPTKQNKQGFDVLDDVQLVCGKKITDRWN